MKKNNNKGFMLTEILVTSTLVCTVLIFLYSQFYNIKKGYDISFKYNTVNGLYAASNVKEYLNDNGILDMQQELETSPYIDLKQDTTWIKNPSYWNLLISYLNIESILFTKSDLTELVSNLKDIESVDENFKRFVRHIDFDSSSTSYRLIIQYNDDTFASILMGDE